MLRIIILICLTCTFFTSTSAKIWRINNTPGVNADFTNMQDAHDAALDGDTLMIEGSSTEYRSLTCVKRLVIIGPGYFLTENPNTPVSLPAVIGEITFNSAPNSGSDPTTGSSGSEVMGLDFRRSSFSGVTIRVNNLVVKKNILYKADIRVDNLIGIVISQNYFIGQGITYSSFNPGFNNTIITNNIFSLPFSLPNNSSGQLLNNLFIDINFAVINFQGGIRNNILLSTSTTDVTISGQPNMITHNTAVNGQFGDSNGNNSARENELFVGPTDNSSDGQWQLLPNSPASGNGSDGNRSRTFWRCQSLQSFWRRRNTSHYFLKHPRHRFS